MNQRPALACFAVVLVLASLRLLTGCGATVSGHVSESPAPGGKTTIEGCVDVTAINTATPDAGAPSDVGKK